MDEVTYPKLLKAICGYMGWTLQHGPPTRTRVVMPPDYNIRIVLPKVPRSDPFYALDKAVRDSLLEILDGYEHKNATPFSQKSYRSLLTGFQSMYVEQVQARHHAERQRHSSPEEEKAVETDDSDLEKVLMGRVELKTPGSLEEARDFLEKLLVPGITAQGRSPHEARTEAMNLLGAFQRMAYLKGLAEGRGE